MMWHKISQRVCGMNLILWILWSLFSQCWAFRFCPWVCQLVCPPLVYLLAGPACWFYHLRPTIYQSVGLSLYLHVYTFSDMLHGQRSAFRFGNGVMHIASHRIITLWWHCLIASCQISLHLVSWALAPGTISSATTSPTSATSPTGDTSTVTASSGEVEPSTSRAGVPAQGVACTWCIVNLYFDLYTLYIFVLYLYLLSLTVFDRSGCTKCFKYISFCDVCLPVVPLHLWNGDWHDGLTGNFDSSTCPLPGTQAFRIKLPDALSIFKPSRSSSKG